MEQKSFPWRASVSQEKRAAGSEWNPIHFLASLSNFTLPLYIINIYLYTYIYISLYTWITLWPFHQPHRKWPSFPPRRDIEAPPTWASCRSWSVVALPWIGFQATVAFGMRKKRCHAVLETQSLWRCSWEFHGIFIGFYEILMELYWNVNWFLMGFKGIERTFC